MINGIKITLTTCLSVFFINLREGLQYRLAALASTTVGVFWAFTEIIVIIAFYRYGENYTDSMPLTLNQAISYIWVAQAFAVFTWQMINPDIYNQIISGSISIELCRPIDLYSLWFAKTASAKGAIFIMRGSSTLIFGLLIPGMLGLSLPPSPLHFALFVLSVLFAFILVISFCMLLTSLRINVEWGMGLCIC